MPTPTPMGTSKTRSMGRGNRLEFPWRPLLSFGSIQNLLRKRRDNNNNNNNNNSNDKGNGGTRECERMLAEIRARHQEILGTWSWERAVTTRRISSVGGGEDNDVSPRTRTPASPSVPPPAARSVEIGAVVVAPRPPRPVLTLDTSHAAAAAQTNGASRPGVWMMEEEHEQVERVWVRGRRG